MAQKIREKNPKTGAPWGAATGIPAAVKAMPKHYFMGTTGVSIQGREPGTECNKQKQGDSDKPQESEEPEEPEQQ